MTPEQVNQKTLISLLETNIIKLSISTLASVMQNLLTHFATSKPWVARPFFVLSSIPLLTEHTRACTMITFMEFNFPQHICVHWCNLRSFFGCSNSRVLWPLHSYDTTCLLARTVITRTPERLSGWSRGCRSEPNHFRGSSRASDSESVHVGCLWIFIRWSRDKQIPNMVWHFPETQEERNVDWPKWPRHLCALFGHDLQEIPDRPERQDSPSKHFVATTQSRLKMVVFCHFIVSFASKSSLKVRFYDK